MKITVLTLFPDMISGFFKESIVKRAQDKGLVTIEIVNIRDFSEDSYKTVDDKPYGGGAGMVMKVDVMAKAIESCVVSPASRGERESREQKIIYTSPKGKVLNQKKAQEFSKLNHLVILAGHYEGVDERVIDFVDEEISLGDFVMTGGELTAAAIVDSVVRLIPGVLKKEEATQIESFYELDIQTLIKVVGEEPELVKLGEKNIQQVKLLEYPQYTRPEEFQGKKVPEVLLSGNHAEIKKWRILQAFIETRKKRPDLLKK